MKNRIEVVVRSVESEPYLPPHYKKQEWNVDIIGEAYGVPVKTTVRCRTLKEAEKVKVGYIFMR